MSILSDLINQIEDESLRKRIGEEFDKISKQKKFGLVFEEHLPECTPLYDIPVKRGSTVSKKDGNANDLYQVLKIKDGIATCIKKAGKEKEDFPVENLVVTAEFGEPIYPYLKPLDTVCNATDSDLWHTLIEADNYHALQLLKYLYAGKVDCIYIDPPYNTGARDWKYNNNYVDGNDSFRHSKWLSMLQKRLKLAKKLLNPNNSVLIVTIDEKEYHHLACLLEEMFPEAKIQMISTINAHAGTNRLNEFQRVNEYIFTIRFGQSEIAKLISTKSSSSGAQVYWKPLRRTSTNTWSKTKTQFYLIFIDDKTKTIKTIGEPLIYGRDRIEDVIPPEGCSAVFPIKDNGVAMMWALEPNEFKRRLEKGYVHVLNHTPKKKQQYSINYAPSGTISDIESGKAIVDGIRYDGSIIAHYEEGRKALPTTQWDYQTHDAKNYGTGILKTILTDRNFPFPKSLYAVHDVIRLFVDNNPNALILDFFAGSGTTLHAVNLLNAEDDGHRRCIMVTNNEVSDAEAKEMTKRGLHPGDEEWENLGIARYVTWPRTVCSIEGHDVNGNPLKGNYIGSDIPMADGFKANAAFFKLGFLDKNAVALGKQFKELLPILWMKSGAHGPCPAIEGDIPEMLILPENRFAVLTNEKAFADFEKQIKDNKDIETVFIVTDSESGYKEMISGLDDKTTYQLYRDYLDNFRINTYKR